MDEQALLFIHNLISLLSTIDIFTIKFISALSLFLIAPVVIDAFAFNEAKNSFFGSLLAIPDDKTAVSYKMYSILSYIRIKFIV